MSSSAPAIVAGATLVVEVEVHVTQLAGRRSELIGLHAESRRQLSLAAARVDQVDRQHGAVALTQRPAGAAGAAVVVGLPMIADDSKREARLQWCERQECHGGGAWAWRSVVSRLPRLLALKHCLRHFSAMFVAIRIV